MRQALSVLLCAIGCVTPGHADAQTNAPPAPAVAPISVDQLVALALDRAPAFQAQRQMIARARGEADQASLRANPMLSTEQREEIGGTDRMTAVMVTWPLELFRRNARVAAAKTQVDVATADVAEGERRLAAEVRRRAVELIAAEQRSAVTDRIAASLRDTYELLRQRVAEGASAPLLRDQAYVEWHRYETQRPLRRADVSAARIELCAAVGLPVDTALVIADDLAALAAVPLPASIDVRADIREAAATVASTKALAESLRRQGRIDFGVFGGYTYMSNSFPQLGLNDAGAPTPIRGRFNNLSIGLSVTLPVANRNQGAVAAAMTDIRAAEFQQAATRLNANAEVAAARARDDESRVALRMYDDGLRTAAQKNLDVVRESFSLGRLSLADVLAEQRRLLDVEMGYVDALAAAALARTNLLFVSGVTR